MRAVARRAALVALVAMSLRAPSALSQDVALPGPMPELRVDLLAGHQPAAQLGAGVQLAVDPYARLGIVLAAGTRLDDVTPRADARLDLLARFLLDPFRQSHVGVSVGGGVGLRAEPGDRVRPVMLVAIELEGTRSASGWVPALQVAAGRGLRVGVAIRRGEARGR